jgi:uncharacterized protein YdhG (YjbR/CyaY superfamily)
MSVPPRAKPDSVAEYVATLHPESAIVVRKVLALVRKNVPGCIDKISYGIPAFSKERIFMYCAAFKAHIGIYPPVRGDAKLIQQLKPYSNAKGNLRFPLSEPMPYLLITQVAKSLAKSYAERPKTKRKSRGSKSGASVA